MKSLFVVNLLLLIALTQAFPSESSNSDHAIFKRAAQGLAATRYFDRFLNLIVRECRINGATDDQIGLLKDDFNAIGVCLGKMQIYTVNKEKYQEHVRYCAKPVVKDAKGCLPEKSQFKPDLAVNISESLISFLYDDLDIIKRSFKSCVANFRKPAFIQDLRHCSLEEAIGAIEEEQDSNDFPNAASSFCNGFTHAVTCMPKLMKEYCEDSEDLRKFANDFVNAAKKPCIEFHQ